MKHLRKVCAAVVLTLALSSSALADGQAHTTITDPPPPSADGQIQTGVTDGQMPTTVTGQIGTGVADGNMSTTGAGQMHTPVAGQMQTLNSLASPVDPATQMALALLQSVWSLF